MAALKSPRQVLSAAYSEGQPLPPSRRFDLSVRTMAWVGLIITVVALAVTTWWWFSSRPGHEEVDHQPFAQVPLPLQSEEAPAVAAQPGLYVHIAGQVSNPGVVELEAGARVFDAVELAGGLTAQADSAQVNLAAVLTDGQYLYIPAMGEDLPPGLPAAAAQHSGADGDSGSGSGAGKLNLNRASATDLESLSGVGPVLAERIIRWRDENGPFTSIDQLLAVSGIGPAKFADLKAQVEL